MSVVLKARTDRPLLGELAADERFDCVCLVRDVDRRHKQDGQPFVRITLSDRSGPLPAILWREEAQGEPVVEPGIPVRVEGTLSEHPRYGRQIVVGTLAEPGEDTVDWSRLVAGPTRRLDLLLDDLSGLLGSLSDERLTRLMQRLLGADTPLGAAYRRATAAKYNHHAYPHGLLEHSLQVARLVDSAAAVFGELDRDLAICGALLHDIGKLEAYESGPATDLTDRGKLEGEIPMGYYRVRRAIEDQGDVPAELAQSLLHIILAHHGRLEHGSPVVPSTREAAVVHAMDALSGTLGAFDRLERETPPEQAWSRYDRVLESSAFLGLR